MQLKLAIRNVMADICQPNPIFCLFIYFFFNLTFKSDECNILHVYVYMYVPHEFLKLKVLITDKHVARVLKCTKANLMGHC